MNNQKLEKVLKQKLSSLERLGNRLGGWIAQLETGFTFYCLTDEYHNRMRFMIPVLRVNACPNGFLLKCLTANYHSALDAKYAINDGVLYSTFIHPLKCLTQEFALDAINQVITLANNTGSTYSSSNLVFIGGGGLNKTNNKSQRLTANQIFESILLEESTKNNSQSDNQEIPQEFCDPITFEIMTNPVMTKSGHTFERATILKHIKNYGTNPFTREKINEKDLIPNRALKDTILNWKKNILKNKQSKKNTNKKS